MYIVKILFKLAIGFYFIFCDQIIISSYLICNYN